jgi:hypothetical protein
MAPNGGDNDTTAPRGAGIGAGQDDPLMAAIRAGRTVDLGGARLDAGRLRDLIAGQPIDDGSGSATRHVTSFGVRIRNAVIVGRLDLEGAEIGFPLAFSRVVMETDGQDGSVVLRDAKVRRLNVSNSELAGGLIADRAEFQNGIMIAGGRIVGAVTVRGAQIGGALAIEGAELGDGRTALLAAGARVTGPLVLRSARCHGEVRLQRAHLEGGLRADEMEIVGEASRLHADSTKIGGDAILSFARIAGPAGFQNATIAGSLEAHALEIDASSEGLNCAGLEIEQSLDLAQARIGGPLNLEGARIAKRLLAHGLEVDGGDTAIAADLIRIGGNWEMTAARLVGQIRMPGADIRGQLRLTGAKLFGSALALRGDGARIGGGAFFSRTTIVGTVRFPAAEIDNQFRFSGATIKVDEGVAIQAQGARFRRDVELNAGFQTIGGIVLDQAQINGSLDLTQSRIKSFAVADAANGPPAEKAQRRSVANEMRPPLAELALSLVDARVDRLAMPERADERPRGIVDLSRAAVGAYVDWAQTWPPPAAKAAAAAPPDHLILDGFVYEHLENPAGLPANADAAQTRRARVGAHRIAWLSAQSAPDTSTRFKPQAWVYLSKQLAAQGLDRDARLITIERRRRERRSRWTTGLSRWESRLLDWFALYGFNPWRTVMWMAAVVVLFAGIWAWAAAECRKPGCFDETVFVTQRRDSFSAEAFTKRYPAFHPLAYSFDVFVPFVSFGYEDHWRPNTAFGALATWRLPHLPAFIAGETDKERIFADVTITTGGILYLLTILEKILGLVLTSLMVTAFTGLLRGHE